MGKATSIAWCEHTFNPWWGCEKVSEACKFCYAEAWSKRTGYSGVPGASGRVLPLLWGPEGGRRLFGEKHWREPLKWNAAAERDGVRRRVFCASMADVFEEQEGKLGSLLDHERAKLFWLIAKTPHLDWLLLTKRPENAERLWLEALRDAPSDGSVLLGSTVWRPNVWLGTTAENQARADERIPILLGINAQVRFVSAEPLLGPLDLRKYLNATLVARDGRRLQHPDPEVASTGGTWEMPLEWVIVGGESGAANKVRPFDITWARDILAQCREAGRVACFIKQLGDYPMERTVWSESGEYAGGVGLNAPDGRPFKSKGGDMGEWPADLRVREFPKGCA